MELSGSLESQISHSEFQKKYVDMAFVEAAPKIEALSGIDSLIQDEHIANRVKSDITFDLEKRLNGMYIDFSKNFQDAKKEFEKIYLTNHLMLNYGNKAEVARQTEIPYSTLKRKVKELDIDAAQFKIESKEYQANPYFAQNIEKEIVENSVTTKLKDYESVLDKDNQTVYAKLAPNVEDITQKVTQEINKEQKVIPYSDAMRYFHKTYLSHYVENNDSQKEAAMKMGISESYLSEMMEQNNLNHQYRPDFSRLNYH